jgi:hypothetical protein
MAETVKKTLAEEIGHTAGVVWQQLSKQGPMSYAKLVKAIGEPRDNVMQAIGWLAREDKLKIEGDSRTRLIGLK